MGQTAAGLRIVEPLHPTRLHRRCRQYVNGIAFDAKFAKASAKTDNLYRALNIEPDRFSEIFCPRDKLAFIALIPKAALLRLHALSGQFSQELMFRQSVNKKIHKAPNFRR